MALLAFGPLGITPIYMGSTNKLAQVSDNQQDHPHIHGEHLLPWCAIWSLWGSPPYTWGARHFHLRRYTKDRITPIYMGSTHKQSMLPCAYRDHPHIHGEHTNDFSLPSQLKGSPPYTWGAHLVQADVHNFVRITPIYMGSTSYHAAQDLH